MIAAALEGENVIVLFKSQEELQRDWQQMRAKADADWSAIFREDGLIKAALNGDADALEKAADANEVALAKIEATRLKAEHGLFAAQELHLRTLLKIRDWINDFNRKNGEHNRLAKRSERFSQRMVRR